MRKALIFMNERIRQKKPRKPVIRVQYPDGTVKEGNVVRINGFARVIFSPERNRAISSHVVRAWIETDQENVRVIA